MSSLTLSRSINEKVAEDIFRRANSMQNKQIPEMCYAYAGLQAAAARNVFLLKALDRMAEVLHKIAESQFGRTRRTATTFADSIEPAHAKMAREAFRLMDEGKPAPQFAFYYAAVAESQGIISAPQAPAPKKKKSGLVLP